MKKKVLTGVATAVLAIAAIAFAFGMLFSAMMFSRNHTAQDKPSWTKVETDLEKVFLTNDIAVREEHDDEYEIIYKVEANGYTYLVKYQVEQIKDVPGFFFAWHYVNHSMVRDQ